MNPIKLEITPYWEQEKYCPLTLYVGEFAVASYSPAITPFGQPDRGYEVWEYWSDDHRHLVEVEDTEDQAKAKCL